MSKLNDVIYEHKHACEILGFTLLCISLLVLCSSIFFTWPIKGILIGIGGLVTLIGTFFLDHNRG